MLLTTPVDSATSAPVEFTTAAGPPTVGDGGASEVGPTAAIVRAAVDTHGLVGTVHLELVPAGGGRTVVTPEQALPPAAGPRQVAARVTGLVPGTTYRIEVVVTTAAGTTRTAVGGLTTRPDTRKPGVRVRMPAAVVITRARTLTARVTCDEPCRITTVARLGVRGGKPVRFRLLPNARITLRLAPVRRTVAADADVRLTLTRARAAAVTALRAGRRVVIRVQVTAVDRSGNRRAVTRFVAVRLR